MGIDDGSEAFRSIVITRVQDTNLQVFAADVFSSDVMGSLNCFISLQLQNNIN